MTKTLYGRLLAGVLTLMLGLMPLLAPVAAYASDEQETVEGSEILGSEDLADSGLGEEVTSPEETTDPSEEVQVVDPVVDPAPQEPVENPEAEVTEPAEEPAVEAETAEELEDEVQAEAVVEDEKAEDEKADEPAKSFTLKMEAHIQKVGWQTKSGNSSKGVTVGTTGRCLRMEALKIYKPSTSYTGDIQYRAHVQRDGWQGWKKNGAMAGTSGRALRIEAIQVKLTGELAQKYDVWYRLHIQSGGWMAWASNGESAGSEGLGRRVESIQVAIVPKGQNHPATSGASIAFMKPASFTYAAMVNGHWQHTRTDGTTAGTTGQGQPVQGIRMSADADCTGTIAYSTLVGSSWTGWSKNLAQSGNGNKIEAFRVKLTGELANYYDVWYRAHVSGVGWLGWAKNAQGAGSHGGKRQVEALQVKLVLKGGKKPGLTYEHYVGPDFQADAMLRRAQGYSSSTGWLILVNCTKNRVSIFRGSQGNWSRIKYWVCTTGKPNTPTIKGVHYIGGRGYSFGHGYTCYYWTQIYGEYLFHSTKYKEGTFIPSDPRLGGNYSMGCVRLAIGNAKYIHDNVPTGTTVVTYA